MGDMLTLDGAHGEGGGQILRTALSLSIITMRAFRLINLRAGRRNPGLLPQHLSAVRAATAITRAAVSGDQLASTELLFSPHRPPKAGSYVIDVAETAERGTAGSVTLILQTFLVPLALVDGVSTLVLRGGTHVDWSPPFDDVVNAYLPPLRYMGFRVEAELRQWGWYPLGGGEVACTVTGGSGSHGERTFVPRPIEALARGSLKQISGRAVAANLPAHIPQRMAERARASLCDLGVPINVEPRRVTAACAGAGIFLLAEYEPFAASFSAYGRPGTPSEAVADEAAARLREHHDSGAAIDRHLADQLLLPLAVAAGPSAFTASQATAHLVTNAWTIGQFGAADIEIEQGMPCRVRVQPRARHQS